jgi:hypothetical protein
MFQLSIPAINRELQYYKDTSSNNQMMYNIAKIIQIKIKIQIQGK